MSYRITMMLLLISLTILSGCKKSDDIIDIPSCLLPTYESFTSSQSNCQGAKVVAYAFREEEVFGFFEGSCISDGVVMIYEQDCNLLCTLGGIAGVVDCDGAVFFDEAIQVRIIWEVQ